MGNTAKEEQINNKINLVPIGGDYEPTQYVKDIFAQSQLPGCNNHGHVHKTWYNQGIQVQASLELLGHYFPDMDKETQERALKTMRELSERYNVEI